MGCLSILTVLIFDSPNAAQTNEIGLGSGSHDVDNTNDTLNSETSLSFLTESNFSSPPVDEGSISGRIGGTRGDKQCQHHGYQRHNRHDSTLQYYR